MASTLQMAGSLAPTNEATVAGVHRSRLSLHLNTPHVRRWLLVQLVSMPVYDTTNEPNSGKKSIVRIQAPSCDSFGRLLDDYLNIQTLRRGF